MSGASNPEQDSNILAAILKKCRRNLLPFVALMFAMSIIDRANVGYAKLALQADSGIGDAAFALGAGIFFIGYAIFEIPSNLILHRVGARLWLSRIMITWGLASAAMMFAHDERSFYLLRFILGVAEAGLSPGVVLYLTYWFPRRERGQAFGIYYFGVPAALLVGGPLSGWLLEMHGIFGLKNWQWMFAVEGLLASVIGVTAFFFLPDRPRNARWLQAHEQELLQSVLDGEEKTRHGAAPKSVMAALRNRHVINLVMVYFSIQVSVYGVLFYLPARIAELLGTKIGLKVGLLTSIPWIFTLATLFFVTRWADKRASHQRMAALMLLASAAGIVASTLSANLPLVLLSFCVAAAGFITVQPLFWTLPTRYLGGVAAAGGIAMIGAVGNLGGFLAPTLKTWMEQHFNSSHAGMYSLAAVAVIGSIMLACIRGNREDGDFAQTQRPHPDHGRDRIGTMQKIPVS